MKTFKQIWDKLIGKKEEPSILEFMSKVEEIAKGYKENYYKTEIELSSDGCSDKGYRFKAYINAAGWSEGKTMEECLSKYKR